ncbi:MAG: hypothetical protein ABIJ18_01230 [archaeon]
MEKGDILLVANESIIHFPYKIDNPAILFLNKERFSKYLDLMKLKKHLNKTPCFIAEMKGGYVIYYCMEIINELIEEYKISNPLIFIRAITLHELYHEYNRIKVNSEYQAQFSENLTFIEMKKDFPKEYSFLVSTFF